MNDFELHELLDQLIIGQQEAFAALVVALGQVIDKDALAEQLRLQFIAPPFGGGRANPVRQALLEAAWKAVRQPPRLVHDDDAE